MMMHVGSAQQRALFSLVSAPDGVGVVPSTRAAGLINKGLVRRVGRANAKPNSPYVCQITDAGRAFVAVLRRREFQPGAAGE